MTTWMCHKRHYAANYKVTLIESTDVAGGLKGKIAAKENVWLLRASV